MPDFVAIAHLAQLAPGTARVVQVGNLEVALFNVDGDVYATENTCCHRGGPLGDGQLNGNTITCPWHMWQFNVVDGACINAPGEHVRTYEVLVEGDEIRVRI